MRQSWHQVGWDVANPVVAAPVLQPVRAGVRAENELASVHRRNSGGDCETKAGTASAAVARDIRQSRHLSKCATSPQRDYLNV